MKRMKRRLMATVGYTQLHRFFGPMSRRDVERIVNLAFFHIFAAGSR